MKRYYIVLILTACFFGSLSAAQDRRVPVALHVHSTCTHDGYLTLEEIAATARANGIKAVIFTDQTRTRWEYGIRPFEHLIKRTIERPSLLTTGAENYLARIQALNAKYPDMVFIPGTEVPTAYYWTGNPLTGTLTLHNWHKHLVVAGLYEAEQYEALPILGNEAKAGRFKPLLMWPALVIFAGGFLRGARRRGGVALIAAGSALLAVNYPFRALPFDQYHGDPGNAPYQAVIDRVRQVAPETGLVFWAHPEAKNFIEPKRVGPVLVTTPNYSDSLRATAGYTGFAFFQEGRDETGGPGGTWDELLSSWCRNGRPQRVWAGAELDYRREHFYGTSIATFQNVLLLPVEEKLTASSVIRGIREGRFYAAQQTENSYELLLDEFTVRSGTSTAGMGELASSGKDARLVIRLSASDASAHTAALKLISEGKVIDRRTVALPATLELPLPAGTVRTYFRLDAEGDNKARIITNPVFVQRG